MILDWLFPEKRAVNISLQKWADWVDSIMYWGAESASGVKVNERTALTLPAFYCGCRKISEAISSLPLHMYREIDGDKKEKAKNNYKYYLMKNQPHPLMTSNEFFGVVMQYLLLKGDFYAIKKRDSVGRIRYLQPWNPEKISNIQSIEVGGKLDLLFTFQDNRGIDLPPIPSIDVLRIPGPLSCNGITGRNIVQLMYDSIGRAKAQEIFSNKLFSNGTRLSGLIKTTQSMKAEQINEFRQHWNELYSGLDNFHTVAILPNGADFIPNMMKPEESQMIESQQFSVLDFCRILNIPPHKLYDLTNAHFNNLEHQNLEWLGECLLPWIVRIEKALWRDILDENEQKNHYFKFNVDSIIRTDIKTRYESYKTAFTHGWMQLNEIREKEDMNPLDDGDFSLMPLNHVPITKETISGLVEQYQINGQNQQPNKPQEEKSIPELINIEQKAIDEPKEIKAYREIYKDNIRHFIRRELTAAKRQLSKSDDLTDFSNWCTEYYSNGQKDFVRNCLNPGLSALSVLNDKETNFFEKYLENFTHRYCEEQRLFTYFVENKSLDNYQTDQEKYLLESEIERILEAMQ